jgi:hypothetical protein
MCVDGIAATAELHPGHKEPTSSRGLPSDKPITVALAVGCLLASWIPHRLFNLSDGDTSIRMALHNVFPVGTVPNDRPIVHSLSILNAYTAGIY